ncbi:MAG: hypothetical protein GKR87_06430 [Kiritimatiellae bacterium]|nr:hypothetical protein [Kiritimatiellia bacterium]
MIKLLKQTRTPGEHKRIQCILLRAHQQMDAEQISKAVGYHIGTVRGLHHEYLRHGEQALDLKRRGGRRHENMSVEEEKTFLKTFDEQSQAGQLLEVSSLHKAYEKKVKRSVPSSTIYRLLQRHHWGKVMPRPVHPERSRNDGHF